MDPVTLTVIASIATILAFVYVVVFGQQSLADLLAKRRKGHKTRDATSDLALAKLEFSQQKYAKVTKRLEKLEAQPGLDTESRTDALLLLAEAEAYSGRPDKAKEHSEEVLSVLGWFGDIPALSGDELAAIGEALNLVGYVWRLHGEWGKALDFYEKSLKSSQGDKEKSDALNNIGNVYRLKGDFDKALTYCKYSLMIRRREKSEEPEHHFGLSLNTLGMVYRDAGNVRQAMRLFREAVGFFEEANSRRGKGLVYVNLGNMRRLIGDYEKALHFLSEARHVFEGLQDEISVAEVFNEIGCVTRDQGRFQEAEDYLLRSLELSRKEDDAFRMVDSLEHLSEVYYQSGDLQKAEQKVQRARELARKHGYSQLESNCLRNLGNVTLAKGLVQGAFSFYAEACLVATSYSLPLYRRHLDWLESQCLELPESQFGEIGRYLIDFWHAKNMANQYPQFIKKCEYILRKSW